MLTAHKCGLLFVLLRISLFLCINIIFFPVLLL